MSNQEKREMGFLVGVHDSIGIDFSAWGTSLDDFFENG